MTKLLKWLFSEAGAGWLVGAVSLIALLVSIARRERPRRLVFRETRRVEPIRISAGIRERVRIEFDGERVEGLGQIEVELLNTGSDAIEAPSITVHLPPGLRVLSGQFLGYQQEGSSIEVTADSAVIRLPFLSSYRAHRHIERVSLTVSGKLDKLTVEGRGEGWSVRHLRLPTEKEESRAALGVVLGGVGVAVGTILYGSFVLRAVGIDPNEWSWRALMWYLPILALLGVWLFFAIRAQSRSRRVS